MPTDHMYYANHPVLWIASLVGIAGPLIMSIYMFIKARKTAGEMGMEPEKIRSGLKIAGFNSIGPSLGVVAVLMALLVTMGAPTSALRLSVIGGTQFETQAANFGAQAVGSELSTSMPPVAFANALWVMGIGASGWLLSVFFFGHRVHVLTDFITKGRDRLLPAVSAGAMLGSFGYFSMTSFVQVNTRPDIAVSTFAGLIIMLLCQRIGNVRNARFRWVSNWALTFAMFGGAMVGYLVGMVA